MKVSKSLRSGHPERALFVRETKSAPPWRPLSGIFQISQDHRIVKSDTSVTEQFRELTVPKTADAAFTKRVRVSYNAASKIPCSSAVKLFLRFGFQHRQRIQMMLGQIQIDGLLPVGSGQFHPDNKKSGS